jgi:starch synthase
VELFIIIVIYYSFIILLHRDYVLNLTPPPPPPRAQGILNGVDAGAWDPATDAALPAAFSAAAPAGKAACKAFLQLGFGMAVDPAKPLVAVISRLVPQKGIHLIEHAVGATLAGGGQFVLLGAGHADGGLRALAAGAYANHPDVRMVFDYSEPLSRQIYAAADLFLVPSMFEPCGLTQMIAMRYGAVPVVRRTGGLADTVYDLDTDAERAERAGVAPNGFVFESADASALDGALGRALALFRERPAEAAALSAAAMAGGGRWGWASPAEEYLQLYQRCLQA